MLLRGSSTWTPVAAGMAERSRRRGPPRRSSPLRSPSSRRAPLPARRPTPRTVAASSSQPQRACTTSACGTSWSRSSNASTTWTCSCSPAAPARPSRPAAAATWTCSRSTTRLASGSSSRTATASPGTQSPTIDSSSWGLRATLPGSAAWSRRPLWFVSCSAVWQNLTAQGSCPGVTAPAPTRGRSCCGDWPASTTRRSGHPATGTWMPAPAWAPS